MKKQLGSIVKFNSGLIIAREKSIDENSSIQYKVLNYKCIDEHGIINDNLLDIENFKDKIDNKYLTKNQDIIVKLVEPFTPIMIDGEHEEIVITSNFCKITCSEEVLPEFLIACLNSNMVAKFLRLEAKNQTFRQISIKELEKIEIEIFDKGKQMMIAQIYNMNLQKISLTKQILKKEQDILKNIYK